MNATLRMDAVQQCMAAGLVGGLLLYAILHLRLCSILRRQAYPEASWAKAVMRRVIMVLFLLGIIGVIPLHHVFGDQFTFYIKRLFRVTFVGMSVSLGLCFIFSHRDFDDAAKHV